MNACSQATDIKDVIDCLKQSFPTADEVAIKTIGFKSPFLKELCEYTNEDDTNKRYVHNTSNCDIYTDGRVSKTRKATSVVEFSRAYFIERNKVGVPTKITAVFRYDERLSESENEVFSKIDRSLFAFMI